MRLCSPLVAALYFSVVLALPATGLASTHPAHSAAALSGHPIKPKTTWKKEVIEPGALVYPKSVEVVGDPAAVIDSAGLREAGGGLTTINAAGPGTPQLAIDLGTETGGYVEVGIIQSSGAPVRLGYSELR